VDQIRRGLGCGHLRKEMKQRFNPANWLRDRVASLPRKLRKNTILVAVHILSIHQ
jgi:hypothetical protein